MSKPAVFPYGIILKEGGVVHTFPAVEVSFKAKGGGRVSLFLLLDSGAALSALPKSDAVFLGVVAEHGAPMRISGVSGKPIKGWRHRLTIRLAGEDFVLPVVFLDNAGAPRVLGRAEVFDRFTIVFEERAHRSVFVPTDSQEAQSFRILINSL